MHLGALSFGEFGEIREDFVAKLRPRSVGGSSKQGPGEFDGKRVAFAVPEAARWIEDYVASPIAEVDPDFSVGALRIRRQIHFLEPGDIRVVEDDGFPVEVVGVREELGSGDFVPGTAVEIRSELGSDTTARTIRGGFKTPSKSL